jgi:phage-related protein
MGILGLQNEQKDTKLIGMFVHLDIHHYLTVYAIAKGVSKAKVLKDMLSAWITEQKEKCDEDQLSREIAQRAMNKWRINKTRGDETSLSNFKESVGAELKGKGFTPREIKRVLNEMK